MVTHHAEQSLLALHAGLVSAVLRSISFMQKRSGVYASADGALDIVCFIVKNITTTGVTLLMSYVFLVNERRLWASLQVGAAVSIFMGLFALLAHDSLDNVFEKHHAPTPKDHCSDTQGQTCLP